MTLQPDSISISDNTISNAKIQLLMELRLKGIRNHALLGAIETVPRERFVPPMFVSRAYENCALPMAGGQTMESPYRVAQLCAALDVRDRDIILDIGTGSGYLAAILSKFARRVFTMELHRELREEAQERLTSMNHRNITSLVGDGHKGWKESAPFDRIVVTSALQAIPCELLEQLTDDGILIAPVGVIGQLPRLMKVTRDKWNYHTIILGEYGCDWMSQPQPRG